MAASGSTQVDFEKLYEDGRLSVGTELGLSLSRPDLPARTKLLLSSILFDGGDVLASIALLRSSPGASADRDAVELRLELALASLGKESQFQSPEETLPSLARARQLAATVGSAYAIGSLHLAVARIEAMRGLYGSARRHLELCRHLLAGSSDSRQAAVQSVISALEGNSGNLAAAEQAAESGRVASDRAGHIGLRASSLANLGSVMVLRGRSEAAKNSLLAAKTLAREFTFIQLSATNGLAQISLANRGACSDRLSECAELIARHRVPARSWYDLMHQSTRCAFLERLEDWPQIVAIVDEVDGELKRRQYRALRTTLLCAQARALAAMREHDRAAHAIAEAVHACPRGAVDPLIVLEATRAACDTFAGRSSADSRFERALAGCRAIGHHYHQDWIAAIRSQMRGSHQVSVSAPTTPAPVASDVLADVAAILSSGQSIDLLAHRTAAFLEHTPLNGRVTTNSTGGHDYQATPTITVSEDSNGHTLSVRASDRRVILHLPPAQSLDDVVLIRNVSDMVRLAVARAAETEHDDDAPNLWPVPPGAVDGDVIFRSPRMIELLRVAERLADTTMPVLLTGETGTGKEIFARFIHKHSKFRRGRFIAFNGPAISKDLVETQLFGHRRGAFTGAHESTLGMIRAAEGGTLFLDEVGDLDLAVQPKLLRFLESGEIQPVGDAQPQSVHVRLVAATNADLDALSQEGRFRRDLFFRLNVARLALPPLRERKDEIPAMAALFLAKASHECGRSGLKLSDDFVAALLMYDWPGNIRQMLNEVRRAVAMAHDGDTLTAHDLAPEIARPWQERPVAVRPGPTAPGVFVRLDQPLGQAIRQVEEAFIQRAMDVTGGRVTDAAKILGLSRKGLFLKRRRRKLTEDESTVTTGV